MIYIINIKKQSQDDQITDTSLISKQIISSIVNRQ
jgi:hypothetical protein